MGQYEVIESLEASNLLKKCIDKGIIPITIIGHKLIYEVFLKHKKQNESIMQAYSLTAEDTNTKESTVRKIVANMKS